jgi:hypothetical protein
MRKVIASLLVYVLVLFITNVSADKVDPHKSKPVYGKKILVSNYDRFTETNGLC